MTHVQILHILVSVIDTMVIDTFTSISKLWVALYNLEHWWRCVGGWRILYWREDEWHLRQGVDQRSRWYAEYWHTLQVHVYDDYILLNEEYIVLNDEYIVLNDEYLVLNDECVVVNDEYIVLNDIG